MYQINAIQHIWELDTAFRCILELPVCGGPFSVPFDFDERKLLEILAAKTQARDMLQGVMDCMSEHTAPHRYRISRKSRYNHELTNFEDEMDWTKNKDTTLVKLIRYRTDREHCVGHPGAEPRVPRDYIPVRRYQDAAESPYFEFFELDQASDSEPEDFEPAFSEAHFFTGNRRQRPQ